MKRIFLIIFAALHGISAAQAAESWSSTCPGDGHTLTLRLESTLELRSELLPAGKERAAFLEDAMLLQLRYHRKATEEKWKKAGFGIVSSTEAPKVELISEDSAASAYSYEITPISHPDVKIDNPYILAALARKKLPAAQPVTRVHFRGSWQAMACGETGQKLPASTKSTAPLDPFLAFWLAPAEKRKLFHWERSEFTLSPSFDSEYADIPDPYYGWYFWRPDFSGKDKFGNEYSSRDYLKEGANTQDAVVSIEGEASSPFLALKHHKPARVNATAVFGIIEQKKEIWKPEVLFAKGRGTQKDWPAIHLALKAFYSKPGIDNGSRYAVDFLANVQFYLDMSKFTWRYDPKDLLLTIEGRLAASLKPFRLRFYFGPTDLLVQVAPRHWNLSVDGLRKDDIFIYHGHSGLGENFRKENIEKFSKKKIGKQNQKQILLIASCYSYSYYSDFAQPDQLLVTGSDYGGAGIPTGLLSWYDRFYVDQEAAVPFVNPHDFLILRAR